MKLNPFMRYFGSKFRSAAKYPPPRYGVIVEPFAGGAGYSLNYADRDVLLVEKNPDVAAVWQWLIQADPDEILALPLVAPCEMIPEGLPQAARNFIGWWTHMGAAKPQMRMVPCAANSPACFWNASIRARTAKNVTKIRHWTCICGDWTELLDLDGPITFFVDPPYQVWGRAYANSDIEYPVLGAWCQTRIGQVIACEQVGDPMPSWLPFEEFATIKGGVRRTVGNKPSKEAIWTNETRVHRGPF